MTLSSSSTVRHRKTLHYHSLLPPSISSCSSLSSHKPSLPDHKVLSDHSSHHSPHCHRLRHHLPSSSTHSLPVVLSFYLLYLLTSPLLFSPTLVAGYRSISSTSGSTLASESPTLSPRTITTKYGQIRGSLVKLSGVSTATYDLLDVEAYLGVPYATPPMGGLRFMPPVTPNHWRGVRLANRLAPLCPQRVSHDDRAALQNEADALKRITRARLEYLRKLIPRLTNQSEDCLYLNIYSPVMDSGPRKGKFKYNIFKPFYLILPVFLLFLFDDKLLFFSELSISCQNSLFSRAFPIAVSVLFSSLSLQAINFIILDSNFLSR